MRVWAVINQFGEIIHLYTDEEAAGYWRNCAGPLYSVVELSLSAPGGVDASPAISG